MTNEQIEIELKHLATKEDLANLRAEIHQGFGGFKGEIHQGFGDFKAEIHHAFGDFKADLIKTIWLTQLSVIGIILVAVGLMIHFKI